MRRTLGTAGGTVALLLLAVVARAAGLPADSILDWDYVTDPRWSPDGHDLVYTRVETHGDEDLYRSRIFVLSDDAPPRALTAEDSDAHSPRWSPNGRFLAFLSNRSGSQQVWALDRRGGEARALTQIDGQVVRYAWSPDGATLALVVAAPPDEADGPFVTDRLRTRNDGARGYAAAEPPRLALAAPGTRPVSEPVWLTGPVPVSGAMSWAADSATLYFSAPPDRDAGQLEAEVYAVTVADRTVTRLTEQSGPDSVLPSPDGRWLAIVGYGHADPPASYQTAEIRLVDVSGEAQDRALTAVYEYSVADTMAGDVNAPRPSGQRIAWTRDSSALVFTSAVDGRVQLMRAAVADGTVEALTGIEAGELREFDIAADGTVAAVFSRFDLPPNIVTFGLNQGKRGAWRQRTSENAALLADTTLAGYEELSIPAADRDNSAAPALQAWLISPPKLDRRRRYPLVLYIHGGPHAMYGGNFFHEFQVLAGAGYHVLIANPRGSSGYGERFGNAIQYRYPGDDADDLMRVLDHVIETVPTVDADRLAIAGGSGGGLLTTWIIARTDRFLAASAQRSVTNWLSFVGTADLNQTFVRHWFETPPWQDPATYLARSPIRYVEDINTPVQLVHSDADYRTPLEQSLQFYTALRMAGKTAELVVFEDESHGLSRGGRPSNRLARLNAIRRWFDSYVMSDPARR